MSLQCMGKVQHQHLCRPYLFPLGLSQRWGGSGSISIPVLSVAIKICGVFYWSDFFSFYLAHSSSDEHILTAVI